MGLKMEKWGKIPGGGGGAPGPGPLRQLPPSPPLPWELAPKCRTIGAKGKFA